MLKIIKNMFKSKKSGIEKSTHPQQKPVFIRNSHGDILAGLKIDHARISGTQINILGWILGDMEIDIRIGKSSVPLSVQRTKRPDVATSLKIQEQEPGFGVEITADIAFYPLTQGIELHWKENNTKVNSKCDLRVEGLFTQSSSKIRTKTTIEQQAAAFIDRAGAVMGKRGLIAGWAIAQPDVELFLRDSSSNEKSLKDAILYQRSDIINLFADRYGSGTINAGFIMEWPFPQKPGDSISIIAKKQNDVAKISEKGWEDIPEDPVGYARWAFSVTTPPELFGLRLDRGEGQFIENLILERKNHNPHLLETPITWRFGSYSNETIQRSVIVPLFGRWDFIEHQLLEFSKDPSFFQDTELIYVIDDPTMVTPLINEADNLFQLYRVPFTLLWGHGNRGFSGANNLGAEHARGEYLIFLNSDAFPIQPGWHEALTQPLIDHPEFGIIGAKLLFPDGGLQHGGMIFFYSETWKVWLNKHPLIGVDPDLEQDGLLERPAVTGACIALRREDYIKVGGFDEGYLIGDFEDSDLCLKIHTAGLKIGCLSTVQLVHLERQSFQLLGDGSFRTLVVRFNAWRHHRRWDQTISQIMATY